MTYDHWKTTEPWPVTYCDVCGKRAETFFAVVYGIETWYCRKCGRDPDEAREERNERSAE